MTNCAPPQDPSQRATYGGQPGGQRDLGSVHDNCVRKRQAAGEQPERERRIEHHQLGSGLGGRRLDAAQERRRGEQHAPGTPHRELLRGVELFRTWVRGRQDRGAPCGQTTPELPQVVLDAAELGRKVVGDEQVLHCVASEARSASRDSRPSGVLGEQRVVALRESVNHREYVGIPRVGDVAERHERVAPQVAGVTSGDVPASVTLEQRLVVRREHLQQVHPRGRRL